MLEARFAGMVENFSWQRVREEKDALSALIRTCRLRRHPLGFAHGELMSANNVTARLHIWDSVKRVAQKPSWFVHTHHFDLKSVVLTGGLTNLIYAWIEDGLNLSERIYEINYGDRVSSLEATNRIGRCELVSSEAVAAGQTYAVKYGEFHNTFVPEGDFTATIAIATKRPGTPLVVGAVGGDPSYTFERRDLGSEEQSQIIETLFHNLIF
jgi:hypothetical protein